MPESMNVEKLMHDLHEQGILNLDTSVRSLLKPEGIGMADPVSPVANNAVAWSEYVLITRGKPGDINEVAQLKDSLRNAIQQPGTIQQ